ncbi:FAA hydrolase family protein [Clostridium fermenticellae]|uniref:FAA hydrolase family protein n=1 Tax=Clostridium fermenticellae TaxID=2068654 RepID=A0A386H3B8_9CLOT|nr:fumarylacetoacetate hydrolase family protein [Clostridium fermenticellae]AYD40154.1 FAA hydrolase family protein [Clostridium fermenticellae]
MKFVNYLYQGKEKLGVVLENKIISLDDVFEFIKETCPLNMLEFIEGCTDERIKKIEEIISNKNFKGLNLTEVKIAPPIPYPKRNIMCLGKNYEEHAKEIRMTKITDTFIPDAPIYFTKIASPAIGYDDEIKFSYDVTNQVDYEAELAIIIGKDGSNIKREEVEDYIFGYTILNDVSARDLQGTHKQWFKGKSLDTFCPMGPYIVYKDEIKFPVELNIKCTINGQVRQNSNTKNMIFDIPYIVSDLSKGVTLKAGDIISTGTPSGVGMGFEPVKLLKDGDIIDCYIEKIGNLVNKVKVI